MSTEKPKQKFVVTDEVRKDVISSKLNIKQLATKYQCSQDAIYRIIRDRNKK